MKASKILIKKKCYEILSVVGRGQDCGLASRTLNPRGVLLVWHDTGDIRWRSHSFIPTLASPASQPYCLRVSVCSGGNSPSYTAMCEPGPRKWAWLQPKTADSQSWSPTFWCFLDCLKELWKTPPSLSPHPKTLTHLFWGEAWPV